MHFDFWSVGLQIINFAVLVWLLNRFLYKPVLAFAAKRQQAVAAVMADAEVKRAAAEDSRLAYERKLAGFDELQAKRLAQMRDDATTELAARCAGAENEIQTMQEAGRRRLEEEKTALARHLVAESGKMAVSMAGKLLADIAGPQADDLFLVRLESHLTALPQARLDSLRTDFEKSDAATIITSMPLEPDRQAQWRQRLAAHIPSLANATFGVDPALIAGVEIRHASGSLTFTWRKSLEMAEKAIGTNEAAA